MRNILSTVLGSALLSIIPLHAAQARDGRGEAELARAIEGRIAGQPVDCIDQSRTRSSRIIDDTAILYETGGTVYVNRPDSGAESLDNSDVLVTKLHSSRLCSIDVVQLYDRDLRVPTGAVFLGKFVPYRKPKANSGR